MLGKSVSTAYYLLTSLCEEGFAVHETKGVYRPARGLEKLSAGGEETVAAPTVHDGLAGTVEELFLLTRKRSYLGVVHSGQDRDRRLPRPPGRATDARPGL